MATSKQDNKFLEFNLPQDAYVAFDATTLKDFIIQRLNENEKFTDQNYEGSNLAAVIDIIAYSYHVLLFYLNNTAAEVDFNQATLYENMNRIVKLIGYKPTGKQTSIVPIKTVAGQGLGKGNYTIRKYSYFLADSNTQYTFIDDYSFDKTQDGNQEIKSLDNTAILYQGTIGEYPDYIAQGMDFESLPIVVENVTNTNENRFIADNTISVYVKEISSDRYYEYKETDSLYLTTANDRVFEKRLNENGYFEVKFGDGSFGRKLDKGDTVAVNYLLSDNLKGLISKNVINGNKLFVYDSPRQRQIFNDTYTNQDDTVFVNVDNGSNLTISNPVNSTTLTNEETVDQIRENASKSFSSQLRLVTGEDYEFFIKKNLSNVVNSIKVVDNKEYLNGYIQYFYDICVDPNKVNRVILNQVNFADACDFNNVNVFAVPNFTLADDGSYPPFLSESFKNLMISTTQDRKMISNDVVPRDPIYMAFGLGVNNTENLTEKVIDNSKLYLVRENTNKISKATLASKAAAIVRKYFLPANNALGQPIKISDMAGELLSIEGVRRIYTKNESSGVIFNGVSFLSYNPQYPESDIDLVNQDTTLPYFKFPYLINTQTIGNQITVIDE
jgi:hypothetical protein|tara:strand:+ start:463 stop:2301 length:1839 start_codon:yes stop_codon:yes gene_type:complete